jgi:hypothetical protein
MAEIFPNEGLDLLLQSNGFQSGGATTPANTWIALFTTFTASTVGNSASTSASYSEPSGGGYAAQTISSQSWGAIASTTSGRITTSAQISFPQATANYSAAVNGYWLRNQLAAAGSKAYCAANFDDTTAVTINSSDQIKVTPSIIYGG